MSDRSIGLKEIENAIRILSRDEQIKLLRNLPKLLDLPPEDVALLKIAESAFDFWDNPEDAIYDSL